MAAADIKVWAGQCLGQMRRKESMSCMADAILYIVPICTKASTSQDEHLKQVQQRHVSATSRPVTSQCLQARLLRSTPLHLTSQHTMQCHRPYQVMQSPCTTCTNLVGDVLNGAISAGAEAHSQGAEVTAVLHSILQELVLAWRSRP